MWLVSVLEYLFGCYVDECFGDGLYVGIGWCIGFGIDVWVG